jgi:hypothetical protein
VVRAISMSHRVTGSKQPLCICGGGGGGAGGGGGLPQIGVWKESTKCLRLKSYPLLTLLFLPSYQNEYFSVYISTFSQFGYHG